MTFDKWFNQQDRLVQIILLLIPGLNWIMEILIRLSVFLRKKDIVSLLLFILVIPGVGVVLGWVDLIWTLLFGHLILAD
ncbi:unknown [Coprobacillus sp. CAG:826]|nr:unknown [Coprobacillus sp. CAG:826]